jgi:hypothetical protein
MPDIADLYLDTYHLHSLSTALPTRVGYPLSGLESPEVRLSSYNNPGAHGQTISNALYGGRVIALQGSVRALTADASLAVAEYRANKQMFAQAVSLQNDSSGFPVTRLLKLALGDGNTYQIPVVTTKFLNPEQLPTRSVWQLDLTATQWYFESDQLSSATVGLPQAGGSSFPWHFPLSFGGGGGGSTIVTNTGTATAYPTITIPGPVISPVISNSTTGQRIQLNLSLLTGDTLVIDTEAHTITQGGATSKIGAFMTGSSFWGLAPGANLITYSANQYDVSIASLSWRAAIGGL